MEKKETNYLVIALIIVAIFIVFFKWDSIKAFFTGKPILPDGTPCYLSTVEGIIKNGVCVPKTTTEPLYEAGKTYTTDAGDEIICYVKPPELNCIETIFKSDSEGGAKGTLYKTTDTACCYLFKKT